MNWTRRQVFRQMAMLAAAVASARGGYAFAASGPGANIVDLGIYRRGRTGPFPKIVKTPAELVTAQLVLPYDRAIALRPDSYPTYSYKPGNYESLGLTAYQGQTGDRQEIGLLTDAQANWLMGGSANNMLAQAEAHGSVPVHQTIDSRVIDVLKYPLASVDQRGAKPFFDISQADVKPDAAHYPPLSYVAFLATGDLYYLAELQFAATFAINGSAVAYAEGKGIVFPWQQRHLAWGLRDIIGAYIATPEGDVPSPLLPKSYWKQILDNNIAWYVKHNASDPLAQSTGFIGHGGYPAPWQQDYISMVLGWAVWTGKVPQLRPLYDFQIRQAVIRASGPLRSQAIQYNFDNRNGKSWAELLKLNNKAPTTDGHYPSDAQREYAGYLRAVLKVAVMNGVPGAEEAYAYADTEAKRRGFIPLRWAL